MKFTKIFTLNILAPLLLLISMAQAAGIPRFYADYAVVQESLKNGKGNWAVFMKLVEVDSKRANFIAEFWWVKAKKECSPFVDEIVMKGVKKIKPKTTKEEKSKIFEGIKKEADQCFYGVYYDHWAEINKMVADSYQRALSKNTPN